MFLRLLHLKVRCCNQCCRSVTFWCGSVPRTNGSGSGSCYFRHWPSIRQQKIILFHLSFSPGYFLKLHLHHFSKIQSFFLLFLLDDRRIRIRNTGCKDKSMCKPTQVASIVTPVPGGVGPCTVACLMQNTLLGKDYTYSSEHCYSRAGWRGPVHSDVPHAEHFAG